MKVLILAPHIDDAILCLGGWLLQNKHNVIDIITIFNTAWSCVNLGLENDQLNDINKLENEEVFKKIKCTRNYWDYPEALARGYKNWFDVLDYKKDGDLATSICNRLEKLFCADQYASVFFPMAIEKHVDHELLFCVIQRLLEMKHINYNMSFYIYEDLPYAYYVDVMQWVTKVKKLFVLKKHIFNITNEFMTKKALLSIYQSQITQKDIEATSLYAQSILPGIYSERIWEIKQVKTAK